MAKQWREEDATVSTQKDWWAKDEAVATEEPIDLPERLFKPASVQPSTKFDPFQPIEEAQPSLLPLQVMTEQAGFETGKFEPYEAPGAFEKGIVGAAEGTIGTAVAGSAGTLAVGDYLNQLRSNLIGTASRNLERIAPKYMEKRRKEFKRRPAELKATPQNLLQNVGRTAYETYKGQLDDIQQAYPSRDVTRNPEALLDPGWWTRGIAQAGTSMASGVLLGGGAGTGTAIVAGGLEALPGYVELVDSGMEGKEAAARSLAFGAFVAMGEKIALDKMFKGASPSKIRKILAGALAEGVTEAAEEPAEAILSNLAREGVTPTEFGNEVMESFRQGANVFLTAAVTGGAMSGATIQAEQKQADDLRSIGVTEAEITDIQAEENDVEAERKIRDAVNKAVERGEKTGDIDTFFAEDEVVTEPEALPEVPQDAQIDAEQAKEAEPEPAPAKEKKKASKAPEDVKEPISTVPPTTVARKDKAKGEKIPTKAAPKVAEAVEAIDDLDKVIAKKDAQAEKDKQELGIPDVKDTKFNGVQRLDGEDSALFTITKKGLETTFAVDTKELAGKTEAQQEKVIAEKRDATLERFQPEKEAPAKTPTKGVGAAAADTTTEFVGTGTGVSKEYTKTIRERLGLSPATKAERKSDESLLNDVQVEYEQNPSVGRDLIAEFEADENKAPTAKETMILLRETVDAENAVNAAKQSNNEKRIAAAEERITKIFDILERSGSAAGSALRARRFMMDVEFNLERMKFKAKQVKGADLTEDETALFEELKKDYDKRVAAKDKTIGKLQAEKESLEQEIAEETKKSQFNVAFSKIVEEVMADNEKITFSDKVIKITSSAADKARARIKERRKHLTAGVDPTELVDWAIIGTDYIAKGAQSFGKWSSKMLGEFGNSIKPHLDEIWAKSWANVRDTQKSTMTEKQKKAVKEADPTDIKALFRKEVEAGERDPAKISQKVFEAVQKTRPDVTIEEVQDEFSEVGQIKKTTKEEVSTVLSDLRSRLQMHRNMKRIADGLPGLKTGTQRQKPSMKARADKKKLNQMMKESGITTTDKETQLATPLDAVESRLQNTIEDLENAIETETRLEKDVTKTVLGPKAKQLQKKRDELRAVHDEMFPKKELTYQQKLNRAIKAAERNLTIIQKRRDDGRKGIFSHAANLFVAQPWSKELSDLKNQQKEARAELAELKDLANPKKTPEQKAIDAKIKRMERAIKEGERQIKEQDFEPKKPTPIDISKSPEALEKTAELEDVRIRKAQAMETMRRKALSPFMRVAEYGLDSADTLKDAMASIDVSGAGRQGFGTLLTETRIWLKNIIPMFKSLSTKQSQRINAEIEARPNYRNGVYKAAGLALNKGDGTGNFTSAEELHRLSWANKFKPIAASNRAYATFLNLVRADAFDKMLALSDNPNDHNTKKIKQIAAGVNELSGRGDIGQHANTLARIFWAPSFAMSSISVLAGKPALSGSDAQVRRMFQKKYLKAMGKMVLIYALAYLFRNKDDEDWVEWDPRSTKFGAIPITKNQSVNPFGRFRTFINLAARLYTGVTKTKDGIKALRDSNLRFTGDKDKKPSKSFGQDVGKVIGSAVRGKLTPAAGILYTLVTGKNFGGRPSDFVDQMKNAVPMAPAQIKEMAETEDFDAAAIIGAGMMLGLPFERRWDSLSNKLQSVENTLDVYIRAKPLDRAMMWSKTKSEWLRARSAYYAKEKTGDISKFDKEQFRHVRKLRDKARDLPREK